MTKDLLNIRDFGAVGDGQADDTAAIQKALDAAGKIEGGVFVPPGQYLAADLKVPSRVMLEGVPTWDYRDLGGSILRLRDEKATCVLDVTGTHGVRLNGLCLDGRKLGQNIHGVYMDPTGGKDQEHNLMIERCKVVRFTGDGVHLGGVWCFQMFSSMLAFNDGCGIRVSGWDAEISGCQLSGNGLAGYGAFEHTAAVTMTGNRIEWNGAGAEGGGNVILHNANHYNLANNYLDRAGGPAIALLDGCITISIVGNLIFRSGNPLRRPLAEHESCHVRFEKVRGLAFVGNTLRAGHTDGSDEGWSPQYAMILRDLANSVIQSNTMHNACLKELICDLGGHGEGLVIANNPGRVWPGEGGSIW